MSNSTKHSKTEKLLVSQKFVLGSLWICNKPNWYFYQYDPSINIRWTYQNTNKRQIKYVQQKMPSNYSPSKETLITENDILFLISKIGNYYKFQYKHNEIIEMRDEFIYKFIEDWTRLTWGHNQ